MKLPSSLREKRHYIVIEKSTEDSIRKILLDYLGIFNFSKAGPKIIQLGNKTLISIERDFVHLAKAALVLSNIKCLKVTGTIRKAKL